MECAATHQSVRTLRIRYFLTGAIRLHHLIPCCRISICYRTRICLHLMLKHFIAGSKGSINLLGYFSRQSNLMLLSQFICIFISLVSKCIRKSGCRILIVNPFHKHAINCYFLPIALEKCWINRADRNRLGFLLIRSRCFPSLRNRLRSRKLHKTGRHICFAIFSCIRCVPYSAELH